MLNKGLLRRLVEELSFIENKPSKILKVDSVAGGSINHCFKIITSNKSYFIKLNSASDFPQMFEKEAKGLRILRGTKLIKTPLVYTCGNFADEAYLIMEFINSSIKPSNFWENFGRQLADLHTISNNHFGLDHDNYIGSLKQSNTKNEDWISFFIEERINPQLKMALNQGAFSSKISQDFEKLFTKLENYFPKEKPSLLHGDLWSGNFMVGDKGEAIIMDPAVYFGHREVDLAMTQLFGGFHPDFYAAYHEALSMEHDWEERLQLYNLYPLLVHVNLFGGSYINEVKNILQRFI